MITSINTKIAQVHTSILLCWMINANIPVVAVAAFLFRKDVLKYQLEFALTIVQNDKITENTYNIIVSLFDFGAKSEC